MGTSISYQTTAPVPDNLRSQVIADLNAASEDRDWWAESIVVFDVPDLPSHVCGDTKLFCLIDDDLADCFMAFQDAEFIVQSLESVSDKYGVDWQLLLAGEPAGRICKGKRDGTINEMLSSFDLLSDEPGDFGSYDREELLSQYHDR